MAEYWLQDKEWIMESEQVVIKWLHLCEISRKLIYMACILQWVLNARERVDSW